MPFDIELYRRTILVSVGRDKQKLRRISVIDMQPVDARLTLVMLHGYGGSAAQWLYQLQYFGQTMRVVAPDLRGHGLSDDPAELPSTMDELVDDLEMTLDRLDVPRPFYLFAHSFGGAVATEYTLRHPDDVRGLVLIGVPSRFILREIVRRLIIVPDPLFSWVAKTIKVALYAPQRTLKRMHENALSIWRGRDCMEQLRVPSLVILGHRDTVFKREYYEDVARSIPGAQQVVIPVSAHLVQLERPDAVNRAIRRFVDAQQKVANTLPQTAAQVVPQAVRLAEMPWLQYYDNGVPESLPLPKQLLQDMLNNSAHDFPDRPALIFFGQQFGYRELDRASNRFAHALRRMGLQKGERVAIILPNVPQYVIGVYGALKAGGVVVLGSPLSNEEEIAYQLQHSGAQVLLTLSAYRPMIGRICASTSVQQIIFTDAREYLPLRQRVRLASLVAGEVSPALPERIARDENAGAQIVAPDTLRNRKWKEYQLQQLLHSQPAGLIDAGVTSDDLALLQYTSGTTDTPKGVMLSHGNLVVNVLQQRHCITDARRGKEVVLVCCPCRIRMV